MGQGRFGRESGGSALVVAAHPDDEVLGCGGVMAVLAEQGVRVSVVFMADGVSSRQNVDDALDVRRKSAGAACRILGAEAPEFLPFPDNRMDQVELLEVVRSLEVVVARVAPGLILTHHGGDLNVDHCRTLEAVLTACRPQPGSSVRAIFTFEVPSSTEWASAVSRPAFMPNLHVGLSARHLERKQKALACYDHELRPFPHARSLEAVAARMAWRGASVGMAAAEGFMVERLLYPPASSGEPEAS